MKLAIVTSHPIQYNAPWFRFLTEKQNEESRTQKRENGIPPSDLRSPASALPPQPSALRVFYLWDGAAQLDPGFARAVKWDIPLLEGYDYEFVPNRAKFPGPGRVSGLNNPDLAARIESFKPEAIVVFGYNYLSHYRFLVSRVARSVPLLFRGDSHLLGRKQKAENRKQKAISAFQLFSFSALLKRLVFRRFSAFLYVGQGNKDYFRHHGVPEHKLFFAPHAVDNDRFMREAENAKRQALEWKAELGIPADNKVILFAGKFEPKKRPGDLIAAFRRAGDSSSKIEDSKSPSSTTLLLVGSGPLEPELRRQAGGMPNIVFAPFQNQSQMPRTYAAADLFVLPSYGSGETWGLAVNEAMCLGLPIIVSDHVGCSQDLVRPRENGLVFPAGNVDALVGALREAFSDSERLRKWGDRSREIIRSYSYEQTTHGLVHALQKLKH